MEKADMRSFKVGSVPVLLNDLAGRFGCGRYAGPEDQSKTHTPSTVSSHALVPSQEHFSGLWVRIPILTSSRETYDFPQGNPDLKSPTSGSRFQLSNGPLPPGPNNRALVSTPGKASNRLNDTRSAVPANTRSLALALRIICRSAPQSVQPAQSIPSQ